MSEFEPGVIPTDPEVFVLDGSEDQEAKEQEPFNDIAYRLTEVGDVLMVPDGDPFPETWQPVDGSTMHSEMWPEYVAKMRITDQTFTLPVAKSPDGYHFLINLGERRLAPPPKELDPRDPLFHVLRAADDDD